MRAFLLAVVVAVTVLAGCTEPTPPVVTPPTVAYDPCPALCSAPVANESWLEYEPSIAVNPTDPKNVVIGVHDDPFGADGNCPEAPVLGFPPAMLPGCFLLSAYVTKDGGATWTRAYLPHTGASEPGTAWNAWCNMGDPVLLFDSAGALYYFGLGISCSDLFLSAVAVSSLFVTKSTDGGATWQDPVSIWTLPGTAQFQDKQWAAVDPATGALAVSWSAFTGCALVECAAIELYASTSTDGGMTWSQTPQVVTRASLTDVEGVATEDPVNYFSVPAWGGNGSLHVSYRACGGDCVRVATQDGETWSVADVMAVDDPGRDGNRSVFFSYPAFATDHSDGPHAGRLYLSIPSIAGEAYDVLLTWSDDEGKTWADPVAAHPFGGDATDQFHHWMDVEGGYVHTLYLDRSGDYENIRRQASWTVWHPEQGLVLTRHLDALDYPDPTGGDSSYLGHYITIDAVDGTVGMTWDKAGQRGGTTSMDIEAAIVQWPEPKDDVAAATTEPAQA